jgi:hypothetical protein
MDRGYSSQLGALLTGGGYLVFTRYQSLVTRHGGWGPLLPTRYQLPATRHGGFAALLLAVDLSPHRQHHIAEHKGIQGDEGDVAAEVEGEHAADEEEEHSARLFAFEVLPGEDRHRSPVEFADLHANRDPHTLFHSGHSAIRNGSPVKPSAAYFTGPPPARRRMARNSPPLGRSSPTKSSPPRWLYSKRSFRIPSFRRFARN